MKCLHRQIFIILLLLGIHIFVSQGAPGPNPGEKKEKAKKWLDDAISKGRDIWRGGDDKDDSSSEEESDELSSYPGFKKILMFVAIGLGIFILFTCCCICMCCKSLCCPPEAQLTAKPYTPRNSTQAVTSTSMPWNQNQGPGTSQSRPMMMNDEW